MKLVFFWDPICSNTSSSWSASRKGSSGGSGRVAAPFISSTKDPLVMPVMWSRLHRRSGFLSFLSPTFFWAAKGQLCHRYGISLVYELVVLNILYSSCFMLALVFSLYLLSVRFLMVLRLPVWQQPALSLCIHALSKAMVKVRRLQRIAIKRGQSAHHQCPSTEGSAPGASATTPVVVTT